MKYATLAYVLSAGAALAHTGHEAAMIQGDAHWLSQPDHAAVVIAGLALVNLGLSRLLRWSRRTREAAR